MNTGRLMLDLVRGEICGEGEWETLRQSLGDDTCLSSLYKLAEAHDMAHIVANALERMHVTDAGEWTKHFEKQRMIVIFRYQQMNYELDRFCEAMEREGIDFIPLKGVVLRLCYPEPWMRTGCDLDFLVRESDLSRAVRALTERLGYQYSGKSGHDVSFFSENNVHIELHFGLVEEALANGCARILDRVWEDYTVPVQGKTHEYAMTDDMFYLYHIAHMAKHIEAGGCGARPFLDLWLLNRSVGETDRQKRDALLREARLDTFAQAAQRLAQVWFSGEEADDLSQRLERYILRAGAYGTAQNKIALRQAKRGGRAGYILSRIFQPYSYMKKRYPVLQKHKWLLPICHMRRWFSVFFGKKIKSSMNELSLNQSISEEQRREGAELIKSLDL